MWLDEEYACIYFINTATLILKISQSQINRAKLHPCAQLYHVSHACIYIHVLYMYMYMYVCTPSYIFYLVHDILPGILHCEKSFHLYNIIQKLHMYMYIHVSKMYIHTRKCACHEHGILDRHCYILYVTVYLVCTCIMIAYFSLIKEICVHCRERSTVLPQALIQVVKYCLIHVDKNALL